MRESTEFDGSTVYGIERALKVSCVALAITLAACGGGGGGSGSGSTADGNSAADTVLRDEPDRPTTAVDASRFLHQASFGPNWAELQRAQTIGPRKYLLWQMALPATRLSYTLPEQKSMDLIHTSGVKGMNFCDSQPESGKCWETYNSSVPQQAEFFKNAVSGADQLRQRMAFALSQILVVSNHEIEAGYAIAEYQQILRDNAFGNYRDLLEKVITSPTMGKYLNMVNNDKMEPNENFARELLQLFSLGPCMLDGAGLPAGGVCTPTYDNAMVRNYAFALTGWTYPAGGIIPWGGSGDSWKNAEYHRGPMIGDDRRHDANPRQLLSGVTAPAGRTARSGLNAVLDSIMAHPNLGPFVGRQLIQFFVTSNPEAGYAADVVKAFNTGTYQDVNGSIGSGKKGDLTATIAAVLLHPQARTTEAASSPRFGKLREPAQYLAGLVRALDGVTEGRTIGTWGGASPLMQEPYNGPSVFNYYPPDQPLPGNDTMVAPQFGITGVAMEVHRFNYGWGLLAWYANSKDVDARIEFTPLMDLLGLEDTDSSSIKVIDRLDLLLTSGRLSATERSAITGALKEWDKKDTWIQSPDSWQKFRARDAAYLIGVSPTYQVQR